MSAKLDVSPILVNINRRHPVRWQLDPGEHPADAWGSSPAWRWPGEAALASMPPPLQQQSDQGRPAVGKPAEAPAREASSSSGRGKRCSKGQEAATDGAGGAARAWWQCTPDWLGADAPPPVRAVSPDLGAELRHRYPRLRPLPSIADCIGLGDGAGDGEGGHVAAAAPGAAITFQAFSRSSGAFSRRAPGAPAFCVAMRCGAGDAVDGDAFPALDTLLRLTAAAGPVPLRFAVLHGTEPCFFDIKRGNLLNLLCAGRHEEQPAPTL